jgi:hypothetical protein
MADWTKTPRFITEINLLRQNTRAVLWRREPYGPVGFDEAFLIEGVVFEIRVVFTGSFPYEAPRVFLLRPALPSFVEVHRFNDGSLCLHGPGETLLAVRAGVNVPPTAGGVEKPANAVLPTARAAHPCPADVAEECAKRQTVLVELDASPTDASPAGPTAWSLIVRSAEEDLAHPAAVARTGGGASARARQIRKRMRRRGAAKSVSD